MRVLRLFYVSERGRDSEMEKDCQYKDLLCHRTVDGDKFVQRDTPI